jgi:hypothetical protein
MDILAFITLTVVGVYFRAESYAFVHPVIRHLPTKYHLYVEQGLLKTFGRVMPVLMTVSVILSVYYAVQLNAIEGASRVVRWASAVHLSPLSCPRSSSTFR